MSMVMSWSWISSKVHAFLSHKIGDARAIAFALLYCIQGGSAGGMQAYLPPDSSSLWLSQKTAQAANTRFYVLAFLAPECPLSINYSTVLDSLSKRFSPHQITLIGIMPEKGLDWSEARAFLKKLTPQYPILIDSANQWVQHLGAEVTPEAFVIDSHTEFGYKSIRYRGAIDDWAVALGRKRRITTQHYLQSALEELLAGRKPFIDSTAAIGCFIE